MSVAQGSGNVFLQFSLAQQRLGVAQLEGSQPGARGLAESAEE